MSEQVAIVIPVFNPGAVLRECIAGLTRSTYKADIVVVDDGSTDGAAQEVASQFPITVVKGTGDLWWSGGMNVGVQRAIERGATHVIAMNHDCQVEDRSIELLVQQGLGDSDPVVGSKILDAANRDTIVSVGGFIHRDILQYRGSGEIDKGQYDHWRHADWLPGHSLMFSTRTFQQLNGFDTKRFPQYFGDSDFVLRAAALGRPVEVCPGSRVWNDRASTGLVPGVAMTPRDAYRLLTSKRSALRLVDNVRFFARHRKRLGLRGLAVRVAPIPLGLIAHAKARLGIAS
jgi:GT2 family glycosyltransferase